jgi:hypothetical protein
MHTDGIWIKDDLGRTLILRGVNLGGSTKVPFSPNGATYRREGFFDHRNVSFVGRPFPMEEADEHLSRLRSWGMTFLRFLITWEAIEHQGPGQYDEAYLEYLHQVVKKAGDYGIDVFIDPHQDVWSRWTGGDGAPGWTLEAVGMDPSRLFSTGAAISHQEYGDPFPRMIWSSNYSRLGAATMFTFFFGGNDFAPETRIEGIPVQEYLQSHYINAVCQVARRLKDLPNVVGYDTLNEPGRGFIGDPDIGSYGDSFMRRGPSPTPFQCMLLGAGYSQKVKVFEFSPNGLKEENTDTVLNPDGVHLWKEGYGCPWKQNGVWTDEDGPARILRPDHFARVDGRPVDFTSQYLKPFLIRFTKAIRQVHPDAVIFLEGPPMAKDHFQWGPEDPVNVVHGGHWYDGVTLVTKHFDPDCRTNFNVNAADQPEADVYDFFVRQLADKKKEAVEGMGGIPTLIGEFGLPFDLDDKIAYRTGDFSVHTQALDFYYRAMEENLLNCTIWNYTADNTNERGDMWNDEDLSIFSRDQQHDPGDIDSGGRGLGAVVRPYARKTAGIPLRMCFDRNNRIFEFEYRYDEGIDGPTEIFVPDFQYPNGYQVELLKGQYNIDRKAQTLFIECGTDQGTNKVIIRPLL